MLLEWTRIHEEVASLTGHYDALEDETREVLANQDRGALTTADRSFFLDSTREQLLDLRKQTAQCATSLSSLDKKMKFLAAEVLRSGTFAVLEDCVVANCVICRGTGWPFELDAPRAWCMLMGSPSFLRLCRQSGAVIMVSRHFRALPDNSLQESSSLLVRQRSRRHSPRPAVEHDVGQ